MIDRGNLAEESFGRTEIKTTKLKLASYIFIPESSEPSWPRVQAADMVIDSPQTTSMTL